MRPETSVSTGIPALHAGMTQIRGSAQTDRGPSGRIFKGGHEEHEVYNQNIRTLRGLRDLRGENFFRRALHLCRITMNGGLFLIFDPLSGREKVNQFCYTQ